MLQNRHVNPDHKSLFLDGNDVVVQVEEGTVLGFESVGCTEVQEEFLGVPLVVEVGVEAPGPFFLVDAEPVLGCLVLEGGFHDDDLDEEDGDREGEEEPRWHMVLGENLDKEGSKGHHELVDHPHVH